MLQSVALAAMIALGAIQAPARAPAISPPKMSVEVVEASFITQYQHRRYHPEPADFYNANCGPASLAMALKALGVAPPGTGPEGLIKLARRAMTGRDEDGSWTYPAEIARAARGFGLEAREVWGLEGILQAVRRGHLVVVNLNPGGIYDDRLVVPYDGGHFALVMGIEGDRVTLDDPLAQSPGLVIPLESLRRALAANLGPNKPAYDGGIEIWR